jgi:hypothetical protein
VSVLQVETTSQLKPCSLQVFSLAQDISDFHCSFRGIRVQPGIADLCQLPLLAPKGSFFLPELAESVTLFLALQPDTLHWDLHEVLVLGRWQARANTVERVGAACTLPTWLPQL